MPISDYNKYKDLTVDSVSGTPTVSKVQPIYLTSGDDSTTGNGEVVLDWSNISGPSDVAVFDQNDNLLDYEIEELDTTNNTGVIWAYSDWVRDGTVQGRIAYGSGPEDRSMDGTGGNPWDNGQKALMVQHFEDDPLSLNDSSPNNNDCTNNGTVSGEGQISSGVSFDGTDWIDTPVNMNSDASDLTVALWIYPTSKDKERRIIGSYNNTESENSFSIRQEPDNTYMFGTYSYDAGVLTSVNGGTVDLSTWKQLVCRWDGTDLYEILLDGSIAGSTTDSTFNTNSLVEGIGDRASGDNQQDDKKWEGNMDVIRFYDEHKSDAWVTSDYDASAKAGQVFFSQESPTLADPPAVDDYSKYKELTVDSVSGTPTVSKAQPIYLTSGDDATTGNGEIVLDWSKISDASDLGIFDQNDNLLDYEIEELDTSNKTGVIWAYNDWVRDGTVQAKLAYGSGPEDRSMVGTGGNPWDNGQNSSLALHLNNDPLTAEDSSPNNRSGTVNGASHSDDADIGKSAHFDGANDTIDFDNYTMETNGGDGDMAITFVHKKLSSNDASAPVFRWGSSGLQFFERSDNPEINTGANSGYAFELNYGKDVFEYFTVVFENTGTTNDYDVTVYHEGNSAGPWNASFGFDRTHLRLGENFAGTYFADVIDEFRVYNQSVGPEWHQAEYDASAKAGQIFFSQSSAVQSTDIIVPGVVNTDNQGVVQTGSEAVVQAKEKSKTAYDPNNWNMLHYHPLDGNGDDVVGDLNLNEQGSPSYVSGIAGTDAVSGDGNDDTLYKSLNGSLLEGREQYSISLWFNIPQWTGGEDMIFMWTDGANAEQLYENSYGNLIWLARGKNTTSNLSISSLPTTGTKHHIVLTYDSTVPEQRFYLDNSRKVTNSDDTGSHKKLDNYFSLMADWGSDSTYTEINFLDEFIIFGDALTDSEVDELYQVGK